MSDDIVQKNRFGEELANFFDPFFGVSPQFGLRSRKNVFGALKSVSLAIMLC